MAPNPYGNAITTEGILQHLLAQLAAEDAAERSRMGAYVGGAIGDYGAVPQGFEGRYGAVSPEVRAMAERNPFSFIKQLERKRKRALGSMAANRAARGVIQSGGTALQAGDIEYDTGLANYGGLRDLMSGISGAYGDYADNVRGRFGQQTDAYGDAMGRLLEAGYSPQGVRPKPPVVGPGRRRPTARPKPTATKYRFPSASALGTGRPF